MGAEGKGALQHPGLGVPHTPAAVGSHREQLRGVARQQRHPVNQRRAVVEDVGDDPRATVNRAVVVQKRRGGRHGPAMTRSAARCGGEDDDTGEVAQGDSGQRGAMRCRS